MNRQSILIVDDTPANIDVLGNILMEEYQVKVATNGPDALKIALSETPPDLILLDVMMPDMDGFEVIKRLKERDETRDIPVIFVTARTEERDETAGFKAGCVDYLHKPLSPLLTQARVRLHMELKLHRNGIETRLKHQSSHDRLTGIANRTFFLERLTGLLEKKTRHHKASVMVVDLDRFKGINDSLGHRAGDLLIQKVAKRFSACLRKMDMVARLGGDEFAILLGEVTERKEITRIADRLLDAAGTPFYIDEQPVHIGASIGIVEDISSYSKPEEILRDADLAMYKSKARGKARFTTFDKSLYEQAISSLKTETELRKAVDNHEFALVFQPITSLKENRPMGFEALVRWNHPERGLLPPGSFISIAEETGLMIPIGRWVVREACRQLAEWLKISPRLTMNVNLSASELLAPGIFQHISKTLKDLEIPPSRLKIEITETVLISNRSQAVNTLGLLKRLGTGIAIDDFGTGYSSLSYLHQFPLDTLKIDRSFIQRIDDGGLEIVKTIMSLAERLGLGVVAEGVETGKQLERIREAGCGHVQGYWFSPPVSGKEAEQMIR